VKRKRIPSSLNPDFMKIDYKSVLRSAIPYVAEMVI
jgi:hypothetical protein